MGQDYAVTTLLQKAQDELDVAMKTDDPVLARLHVDLARELRQLAEANAVL